MPFLHPPGRGPHDGPPHRHHPGPPHHHHHHGPPHHAPAIAPDEYDVLGLYELMRSRRPPQTTQELADLADRLDPDSGIGAYLREECADLSPMLALDDVAVQRRKQSFRRVQDLLQQAGTSAVVFIPPVPRHISDRLLACGQVAMIEAGHDLPPHLRHELRVEKISDPYSARACIETADVVVFDGFFGGGVLHVRRAVAAILDQRLLKPAAGLFAHFRGRPFPEDVPLPPDMSARINRL